MALSRDAIRSMLKEGLKAAAKRLLGDYGIYRVFVLELSPDLPDPRPELEGEGYALATVTREDAERAGSKTIRDNAWYGGEGSKGFAILRDGEIVAMEWYWYGSSRGDRLVWPLADDEAESAYIVTDPEMRGRRLAQRVKQHSALEMRALGFQRAYGKVWYNHHASIGANLKSGFREIGFVIVVYPFGLDRRLRYVRRRDGR